jgi:hypothetical protein
MILTACFSATSLAQSRDALEDALKRDPAEGRIERYFLPTARGEGWFLHNAYRETLINLRLRSCLKPNQQPSQATACVTDAPALLDREPSSDRIEKEFVPKGPSGNGWWVHNQYRESLINLELHRCEELKNSVVPACTGMAENVQGLTFWQTPLGIGTLMVLSFGAGAYLTSHPFPRLQAHPTP